MGKGGGQAAPAPPPAPDYAGAANATAAGNLEAAKYATNANRINQYTPYGSLTYTRPENSASGSWEQTETLAPEAKAALDQQLALNRKYGETANVGFDKTRQLFENPELDTSGLTPRAINAGQTAQDAIMSRMRPQLARQEEELRTRMANQGITLGSQAYNTEQNLQGQRRNDLEMQAAVQGISLDQNNRSSALEEQAYLQDRPLNLINALRSGNQVQAPKFQQFANQATTSGPDMMGAASAGYGAAMNGYNANMDNFNANQAQSGNAMGGLFSLAGAGIGGMMGGIPGAQLGAGIGGGFGRSFR